MHLVARRYLPAVGNPAIEERPTGASQNRAMESSISPPEKELVDEKRMALVDKLGSADSVETFARDAMKGDDSVAWLTWPRIPGKSDVYILLE